MKINFKMLYKSLILTIVSIALETMTIKDAHAAASTPAEEHGKSQFYIAYFHGLGGSPDGIAALTATKQAEFGVPKDFFATYFPKADGGSWFDVIVSNPYEVSKHLTSEMLHAYLRDPIGNKDTIPGKILSNIQAAARTQLTHIEAEMKRLGIPDRNLILAGESQGGLLAWAIAYERRNHPAGTLGIATTSAPPLWLTTEGTCPEFAIVEHNSDDLVFPGALCDPLVAHVKGLYPADRFTHISPGGGHTTSPAFHAKALELLSLIVPKPAGA